MVEGRQQNHADAVSFRHEALPRQGRGWEASACPEAVGMTCATVQARLLVQLIRMLACLALATWEALDCSWVGLLLLPMVAPLRSAAWQLWCGLGSTKQLQLLQQQQQQQELRRELLRVPAPARLA